MAIRPHYTVQTKKSITSVFSILANIIAMVTVVVADADHAQERAANRILQRRRFWETTSNLDDAEFKRAFRMSRATFRALVDLVRHKMPQDEEMGLRSSAGVIEAEVRIAVMVRIMAGSTYVDMMIIFGLAKPTVYQIFSETVDIVIEALPLAGFPEDEAQRRDLSIAFTTSRTPHSPLMGCVGALDGIAVRIIKPRDCNDPAQYWCRKGFYALPVQAVADASYRFTYVSIMCAGSTHDSVAFSVSSLARRLHAGDLPAGYWYAGDEAYVCTESLLTPISAARAVPGSSEDAFNFFHSSLRMHVEQSFGQLVARWGIFWSPLRFSLQRNARIVHFGIALHNFCIDQHDECLKNTMTSGERFGFEQMLSDWNGCTENGGGPTRGRQGRRTDVEKSALRAALVSRVSSLGFCRPTSTV